MNPASMTPAQRDAHRYRRPNYTGTVRVKGNESAIYFTPAADGKGKFYAIAYAGKTLKRAWHFSFGSQASMAGEIERFVSGQCARIAAKKADKGRHTLKVGDVLRSSWGYDQTNVDHYQVTRVSTACVWIREIGAQSEDTGWLTGNCAPMPGKFIGEETRHAVNASNAVKVRSFAWASKVEVQEVGGVKMYEPARWSAYA